MHNTNDQKITYQAIALGVITAILWAMWPVMSRFSILQSMSANDIAMVRFWVAGCVLLPYLIRKGWGGLSVLHILFISSCGGMLYVFVALSGLNYAPSNHSGMFIPSSTMVFAVLGSWLVLGDKPKPQRLFGMVIIIVAIFFTNQTSSPLSDSGTSWIGHFLFVFAGFCWGCYTVAAQRAKLPALHLAAIVSVISMVVMTPLYFVFGSPTIFQANLGEVVFQGIFQGVIIAIVALFTYTKTIELLGSSRTALFVALVPGLTTLIAYPVLGEVPSIYEVVGLLIVTIGMVIAIRSN